MDYCNFLLNYPISILCMIAAIKFHLPHVSNLDVSFKNDDTRFELIAIEIRGVTGTKIQLPLFINWLPAKSEL